MSGKTDSGGIPSLMNIDFMPMLRFMGNNPMGNLMSNSLNMQPPPPPPVVVNCGELQASDAGKFVEICGKISRKRIQRFAELRDRFGVTQLLLNEELHPRFFRRFAKMPEHSMVTIVGNVLARPIAFRNASIKTGEIEVEVVDILSCVPPPQSRPNNNQKRSYSTMTESNYRGITSTEFKFANTDNAIKYFDNRDKTCNDLRLRDVGTTVQLVGWFSGITNTKFQQLRDGYGQTQVIVENENEKLLQDVNEKSLVLVKGRVVARPVSNRNVVHDTGDIEVIVEEFKIIDPDEPYTGPVKEKICSIQTSQKTNGRITTPTPLVPDISKYTHRTHTCSELNIHNVNEEVVLCGWLEFQRMNKFFVLRDGYGQIQVIVPPEILDEPIEALTFETVLKVAGTVIPRPTNMRNASMVTGDIEIAAKKIEILNEAIRNLPIEVRGHNRSKEILRMEYRYIDLRFPDMQKNLRLRSSVLMKMREFLINHVGFVEVETPTLFRRTPGGAQEFVVPTRKPGHFYSLVQSPQQFKQMLMAGAIDRYFQIARCYRDEATRPDRQPEFTQLDIELSFTNKESILQLVEDLLTHCWPESLPKISIPFTRITYDEAMDKYGSDKPDMSFDMTLKNITFVVAANEKLVNDCKDFGAYAIVVKSPNSVISSLLKKELDILTKKSNCKLVYSKVNAGGKKTIAEWSKGLANLLSADIMDSLVKMLELENDDVLFLSYGSRREAQTALGRVRLLFVESLEASDIIPKRKRDQFNFVWVVDFPMFTKIDGADGESYESTHHPFTAAHEEDNENLQSKTDLEKIRSQAYDLVLNGQEVGGGSIRIHSHDQQLFVLEEILKIPHEHLQHLLDALKSGCPPHGGIALGLDRLMAILCNATTIRDVIAFPKGSDGKDPLSKAPVPISDEEKKLYGLVIQGDDKNDGGNA